ncbi:hypothetical protein NEAUS03_0707 [Nematocida ausubeli]|nr:hypothetical protein NEAUS03_0707 [Nematocida ausubeli]
MRLEWNRSTKNAALIAVLGLVYISGVRTSATPKCQQQIDSSDPTLNREFEHVECAENSKEETDQKQPANENEDELEEEEPRIDIKALYAQPVESIQSIHEIEEALAVSTEEYINARRELREARYDVDMAYAVHKEKKAELKNAYESLRVVQLGYLDAWSKAHKIREKIYNLYIKYAKNKVKVPGSAGSDYAVLEATLLRMGFKTEELEKAKIDAVEVAKKHLDRLKRAIEVMKTSDECYIDYLEKTVESQVKDTDLIEKDLKYEEAMLDKEFILYLVREAEAVYAQQAGQSSKLVGKIACAHESHIKSMQTYIDCLKSMLICQKAYLKKAEEALATYLVAHEEDSKYEVCEARVIRANEFVSKIEKKVFIDG